MIDIAKFLQIAAALAAMTVAFAPQAMAYQYCHPAWTPEKGDYQVCENSPDPRYQTKCHSEWNPQRGDYQVCQQSD